MPRNNGDEYREDKNGIIRDRLGRVAPGQSLNPKGARPRRRDEQAREDVEPIRQMAVDKLGEAVKDGKAWAILEVLNRSYGKPTDKLDVSHDADLMDIVLSFGRPDGASPNGVSDLTPSPDEFPFGNPDELAAPHNDEGHVADA